MTIASMRPALLTTAVFAIAALALLGARPLWLDEILQLRETRTPSAEQMIANLPRNAGAAPLGYLVQHSMLRVTGYSVRRARLPAAIFGIATVFTVAVLASELGVQNAWVAAALFAFFPMTLRYATESRVYPQALFLSVLATLAYLRLSKQPTAPRTLVYWLALTAAAWTQPYSACVGIAHILWSARFRERRATVYGSIAVAGAIAAFLPWYLWSKGRWAETVAGGALHFSASWKTPLLLFRELTGGGYWCGALVLVLCVIAVARRLPNERARALLVLLILVPLVCIFTADGALDYFVASRQFMWVLPALALLAAVPVQRGSRTAAALTALTAVVCVVEDVRYFRKPQEDWAVAADAIAKQEKQGACFSAAPANLTYLYEFFRPELARAHCEAPSIVLAITPYTTNSQRDAAIALLSAQGYRDTSEIAAGGSRIILFQR